MEKQIITDQKILSQKSIDAGFWESRRIIKDLEDTLKTTKTGIGLSAIQIGIPKNVSIIRFPEFKLNLVNAKISYKADPFRMKREACLSFPGLEIDTRRFMLIQLANGKLYKGLVAVAIQHELDHQKGIVILDRKWRRRR